MRYRGKKTNEISFPLGGIGTGCVGLSGNGRLIDWEIFGRPNKGGTNGFSFIAVKAERADGGLVDSKALNGDLPPPYSGHYTGGRFHGYGFGPDRNTMAGFPHFEEHVFDGEFPVAEIDFKDDAFPGDVRLRAFNPLIPLNDRDSTIPAAFFEVVFTNTSPDALRYTAAFTVGNPFPGGVNRLRRGEEEGAADDPAADIAARGLTQLVLASPGGGCGGESDCDRCGDCCGGGDNECDCDCGCGDDSDCGCDGDCRGSADAGAAAGGELCVGTDAADVSWQEYWFRGMWFDGAAMFWRDFTSAHKLQNRAYDDGDPDPNAPSDAQDHASLAAHTALIPPGGSASLRFTLSWNIPAARNDWNPPAEPETADGADPRPANSWTHYYATLFKDSAASGAYALREWDRLYAETREFRDLIRASTLPSVIRDAVTANISILKSPTCLRLEDGSFYAFEGCHCAEGCCEGSCTHVWNYAYALPFLFPALERSMRTLNYAYNQGEDGSMSFRLQLPPGRARDSFRPCADGQFGDVIKTYRDWKISGDDKWLRTLWEPIKRSIAFAWSGANADRWDPDMTGVLHGRQHHTLDMELFGPNSWLTGFYLAALAAAVEMAEHLGEPGTAAQYLALFEKGRAYVDAELWDGGLGYFTQKLDLGDASALNPYEQKSMAIGAGKTGRSARDVYWNPETREIKYQFGRGCAIDQVLAQWHANIAGLGRRVFDAEKTRSALSAIHRHNYLPGLRRHTNPCRLYAVNDEAGAVICAWPDGVERPAIAAPYAEETWSGCEYQAAAHMIQEGLVEEGIRLTKAVRDRYDGEKRNPWNEFECGSNYARSMASYSLLLAYSGFSFDMTRGYLGFRPARLENGEFRSFWSVDAAWGGFEISGDTARLRVRYGELNLKRLDVAAGSGRGARFEGDIRLTRGQSLTLEIKQAP